MAADASVFFALWLQRPLPIAVAHPRSVHLRDAVDLSRRGPALEFGAGTGSLTRGLLRAGYPPEHIIVLKREPEFAGIFRQKSSGISVIEGDAKQIGSHPTPGAEPVFGYEIDRVWFNPSAAQISRHRNASAPLDDGAAL